MTEQGNASAAAPASAAGTVSTTTNTSVGSAAPSTSQGSMGNTPSSTGMKSVDGSTSGGEGLETPPPAYNPNFKFKVMDKEQEFDEWIRPLVKDADSEKRVRDLMERAYGIDAVKQDRAKVRESFQALQQENTAVKSSLESLSGMVRQRDPRFFKAANIPDDFVLEAAHKILKEREMPPEQRAAHQQNQQLEERYHEMEERSRMLADENQKTAAQYRNFELQTTLQSPEVSNLVQTFDSKVGAGKFRAEVIKLGQWYWATQQVDKPVKDLVQEVAGMTRAFIGENQGIAPGQNAPGNVVTQQTTPTPKVIPSIEGKGTSPTKKPIRDLNDLKALRTARTA